MKIDWRTALGCAGVVAFLGVLVLLLSWGGRHRQLPRPEHQAVARDLTLRGFQQVPASDVFRATLTDGSGGLSSGYGRSRNVLFVEDSGDARWLLPDDDHVLDEFAISPQQPGPSAEQSAPLAMAVLAKPVNGEAVLGDLYLCDPAGRRVQRIAAQVSDVHGVALSQGAISLLYENPQGYVLAHYAQPDFHLLREVMVKVPALK